MCVKRTWLFLSICLGFSSHSLCVVHLSCDQSCGQQMEPFWCFVFFDYAFHAGKLVHLWKGFVEGRLVSGYSFCSLLPPLPVLIFQVPKSWGFHFLTQLTVPFGSCNSQSIKPMVVFSVLQQSAWRGTRGTSSAERTGRLGPPELQKVLVRPSQSLAIHVPMWFFVSLMSTLSSLRLLLMLCSLAHAGGSTDDSCAIHPQKCQSAK